AASPSSWASSSFRAASTRSSSPGYAVSARSLPSEGCRSLSAGCSWRSRRCGPEGAQRHQGEGADGHAEPQGGDAAEERRAQGLGGRDPGKETQGALLQGDVRHAQAAGRRRAGDGGEGVEEDGDGNVG